MLWLGGGDLTLERQSKVTLPNGVIVRQKPSLPDFQSDCVIRTLWPLSPARHCILQQHPHAPHLRIV